MIREYQVDESPPDPEKYKRWPHLPPLRLADCEEVLVWSTEAPQVSGDYWFRCNETDMEMERVKLYRGHRGWLLIDTGFMGTLRVKTYHDGMTTPEWACAEPEEKENTDSYNETETTS